MVRIGFGAKYPATDIDMPHQFKNLSRSACSSHVVQGYQSWIPGYAHVYRLEHQYWPDSRKCSDLGSIGFHGWIRTQHIGSKDHSCHAGHACSLK